MSEQEMAEKIDKVLHEYKLNMAGVKEVFKDFMFELQVGDQHQLQVESNLTKMLSLRFRKDSPRNAPTILLIGPPGAGKCTQGHLLSQLFGVVHISVK